MNKPHLLIAMLAGASVAAAAWAQPPAPDLAAALLQARMFAMLVRTGAHPEAGPKGSAVMEAAVAAWPASDKAWAGLGVAYLTQASGAVQPGGNRAEAATGFQKAGAAFQKALTINPDNADALAGLGSLQVILAGFMRKPEMATAGVAQMDRAIALEPRSAVVRLQRAFSGLNAPAALRNHANEAEDLAFLAKVAEGHQSGDYIHMLLGDLYAETGQPDLARAQYRAAARPGAKAAPEAEARLVALAGAGVPGADIERTRKATGTDCAMCHGG